MTPETGPGRVRRGIALGVGIVGGLVTIPLARHTVAAPGIVGHGQGILRLVAVWAAVATLATAALLRAPKKAALVVILGIGVAVRLASFAPVAPLSDDLYRYAWDGRVQAHAIDPYRYAPDAQQLRFLRDPAWLWPLHRCLPDHTGGCSKINRQTVHTIYPPVAEAWFTALDLTRVTSLRDHGLEGAGLVVDLAILAVMLSLLRRGGRDPRWLAVWALSPLPVLELVADAHVDGLALLLTIPALESARRRRPGWAGILLGLAVLVKLYPLLLLPALMAVELQVLDRDSIRRAARSVFACVGVIVLGYLPHVIVVGTAVVGYLPGYLKEEHYTNGTRYLLLADLGLRAKPATAAVGLVLLATVVLVLVRRPPPMLGATWLYGALLLLTTPVQPWYGVGLAGVALLAARPEWMLVGLAGYPLYVQTVYSASNAVDVGRISYGIAAFVIALTAAIRALRSRRGVSPGSTSGATDTVAAASPHRMAFRMRALRPATRRPATRRGFAALGILAGSALLSACSGSASKGPVGDQVTAITELTGTATSVTLDRGTLAALKALEVTLKPLGAAKLADGVISFPITSGYAEIHSEHTVKAGWVQGQIQHDTSGFSLSSGQTTVTFSNFVVDPGTSMLYGTVNGSTAKEPLLFLDGRRLQVSMSSGTVTLDGTQASLTQTAATALDGAFRTNDVKPGLPFGSVHLVATATHVVTFAAATTTNLDLGGLSTSVTIPATTTAALSAAGLTLSTIGTAKSDTGVFSFPITGGFVGIHADHAFAPGFILGSINHEASGLVFTGHGTTVTLRDLVVDPGNSMVSARIPNDRTGGTIVQLFSLDGSQLRVSTDKSGNTVLDGTVASLTGAAAKALDAAFGISNLKAGLTIGTVELIASPAS